MADAGQFRKVKSIIEADPARKVIVVSAAGKRFKDDHKLTDLLYLCHAHKKYGVSCDPVFDMIADRYREICAELGLSVDIDSELSALREEIESGISKDKLVSRGEYFSAKLMADFLGYDFLDAELWLHFSFDGTIDKERSYEELERLATGRRIVTPGFYGAMPDGTIKTFSRGGSDFTGSVVAKAAKVDIYENWTDVSGFLVADPRIVENPEGISVITYSELRELSYMGAGVLHEDAIFPVRSANIPINIKNTNAPQDAGTLIVPTSHAPASEHVITGIAGKKNFSVISIEKDRMNSNKGFLRKLLQVLENHDIFPEHMPTGIDTVSVVVNSSELDGQREKLTERLVEVVKPDHFEIIDGLALIAVVGRGMRSVKGTATRVFAALSHANINIRMIDQGSSELNIIIGINAGDFDKAIKVIYDMFILSE